MTRREIELERARFVYRLRVVNLPEPLPEAEAKLLLDCAFDRLP